MIEHSGRVFEHKAWAIISYYSLSLGIIETILYSITSLITGCKDDYSCIGHTHNKGWHVSFPKWWVKMTIPVVRGEYQSAAADCNLAFLVTVL